MTPYGMAAFVLTLAVTAGVAAASTFKVNWNTDPDLCSGIDDCVPIGPDGPWQVLMLQREETLSNDGWMRVYPRLDYGTLVQNASMGGDYDPGLGSKANDTRSGAQYLNPADLVETQYINEDMDFQSYFDIWQLPNQMEAEFLPVNLTVYPATKWNINLPNGKHYSPEIGYLGLAPPDHDDLGEGHLNPPAGVLQQLKANKTIGSNSLGMHIGSASLKQSGSLILGGYDQSRALGDVGQWNFTRALIMFLKDVTLGVEKGGSPFTSLNLTEDTPASLWRGNGGSELSNNMTRMYGGPDGSVLIQPMPSLPSVYLPLGNCEAVTEHLPVTYRNDIGYYVWNVDDPLYHTIISSPAYMGFVLATPEAKNLTIKVPFGMLNLTLESPIVDKPTPYFPCHTVNSLDASGAQWALGRAFLQAAFVHMDYDRSLMSIAQAPGPKLEQALVHDYIPGDAIKSNPISSFRKTWQAHWTELSEDGTPNKKHKGLSSGAMAGIVVGVVVAVAIVAMLIWFLCRRRRSRSRVQELAATEKSGHAASSRSNVHGELHSEASPIEVPATQLSHEVEGDKSTLQSRLPHSPLPLELPGDMPKPRVPERRASF